MGNKQMMILATERLLHMCWEFPDDNDSAPYWAKLLRLQKAIDDLEDFDSSSAWMTCPQDHDSAIGTPDNLNTDTADIGVYGHVSSQHQEGAQDPSALAFEEIHDLPLTPDNFGSPPPLPDLQSIGQSSSTPLNSSDLIDFDSYDDVGHIGETQTGTQNYKQGGDQEQRDENNQPTPEITEDVMSIGSRNAVQYAQTTVEKRLPQMNPAPTKKRMHNPPEWQDLGKIIDKVVEPAEIYGCLERRAPDGTSPDRLEFLTRLLFHYAGPYAFAEAGAALSTFYQATENDYTSVAGIVRALDRIELTIPIERRACWVALGKARCAHQKTWALQCKSRRSLRNHQRHKPQPGDGRKVRDRMDIAALRSMMADAYPSLKPEDAEYCIYKNRLKRNLNEASGLFKAHERCPSFTWMFPRNLSEKKFRRLPEPLITVFLYILYEYRGDFLRQVDDLLGPYVADFVAGKRPVQPFAFGENTMKKMQKQAMDSSYFLDLCNLLVSTMDDPG